MFMCSPINIHIVAPYDVIITADFSGDVTARPVVVEYGDTLTLNCSTDDLDNAFHWFKNDVLLQENSNVVGITAVRAADGGLYECVVNNTAGTDTANITIYGESCLSQHILCTYA